MTSSTVLITGASIGIGAVYANRFARRGHDLVLVARDHERLDALAARLTAETDSKVDIIQADLTRAADLAEVEKRLREDATIEILINNAGAALSGQRTVNRGHNAPDHVKRHRINRACTRHRTAARGRGPRGYRQCRISGRPSA
ncbi:hypothetical protein thsps117_35430 [Pseudomonas sp. No.117]